ncbi:QueT transporter family protein [Tepidibacillus infernus]|uniref:QueT transporter family protein n=1 Tax=Tepidibacillus TaxID=1494427 RepID=UPI000858E69A|nr:MULTISPECIES: QueT transporter family protein [Tepidibacillus]GBF10239.1 queuosine precursor transporter QueT [Tepidibacillus sp. HK-1]
MKLNTKKMAMISAIAALYAVLTIAIAPLSYGWIQFRVAEALTILPFFTPLAIPGLAIGVLIANIISPLGIIDMVVGTLATLIAAIITSKIKNKWLVPWPPILINAIFVGLELGIVFSTEISIPLAMLWVGIGELGVLYLLGMPLLFILERRKDLFR